MDKTTIAYRIRKIREYRNYTQAYIALKLGIKQNTYSELESGRKNLKPSRIAQIAQMLNVPAEAITNDKFELFNTDTSTKQSDTVAQLQLTIKLLQDDVHYLRHQNDVLIQAMQNKNPLQAHI